MGKSNGKALKRTIKFLSICKNPQIISHIIERSPDSVIKSICNAALNVAQGDVVLNNRQKKILAGKRRFIEQLISKGDSVKQKRKLIQKGGSILGFLIPTILGTVLSSLGSKLFSK